MNPSNHRFAEAMTDRQGLRLAALLNVSATELDRDITERLRAARERALAQRKVEVVRTAPAWVAQGATAALGWGAEERMGWWGRLCSALTLGALVLGLWGINQQLDDERARELADVDVAILTDTLPPAAFADPGFIRYLQSDEL